MTTITPQQQQAIADLLTTMTLPSGLGSEENACSIAAINLALSGQLTDDIPACMSLVIGRWIIGVQDAMPADMRNSAEWKRLLPLAAGTGRGHEEERLQLILNWMWETVLPIVQPIADRGGFGAEWRTMLRDRTPASAAAAAAAARAAAAAAERAAAAAATWAAAAAARAAADAAAAAAATTWAAAAAAATWAAAAATAAAHAVSTAAEPGTYATRAAERAAAALAAAAAARAARAAAAATWQQLDPCGLLQRLITIRPYRVTTTAGELRSCLQEGDW